MSSTALFRGECCGSCWRIPVCVGYKYSVSSRICILYSSFSSAPEFDNITYTFGEVHRSVDFTPTPVPTSIPPLTPPSTAPPSTAPPSTAPPSTAPPTVPVPVITAIGDTCIEATVVTASKSGEEIIISGSTLDAVEKEKEACSGIFQYGNWFKLSGFDGSTDVYTTDPNTDFDTFLYFYKGGTCGKLSCGESNDDDPLNPSDMYSSLQVVMEASETYYILVTGYDEFTVGNYVLHMYTPNSENDFCTNAVEIVVGDALTSSTNGATIDMEEGCSIKPGTGVWYKIEGNGGILVLSTCNKDTNFDTVISVFGGNCYSLFCVTESEGGPTASRTSWLSEKGVTYYILVHGKDDAQGEFVLSAETQEASSSECLSDQWECPESLLCIDQTQICDGEVDCVEDESDETYCEVICPKNFGPATEYNCCVVAARGKTDPDDLAATCNEAGMLFITDTNTCCSDDVSFDTCSRTIKGSQLNVDVNGYYSLRCDKFNGASYFEKEATPIRPSVYIYYSNTSAWHIGPILGAKKGDEYSRTGGVWAYVQSEKSHLPEAGLWEVRDSSKNLNPKPEELAVRCHHGEWVDLKTVSYFKQCRENN